MFENGSMSSTEAATDRRETLRAERLPTVPYRGHFEWRIIITFLAFAAMWLLVVALGATGAIPLWVGTVLNAALAATFYMPLHEAVHGNIWGSVGRYRWCEDLIGVLCAVPLASTSYASHRIMHMRHHAYTNDPVRDPDHFVAGSLGSLVPKLVGLTVTYPLLPLLMLVPQRHLPEELRGAYRLSVEDRALRKANIHHWVFWGVTHAALLAAFLFGFGWEALMLWYLPARLAAMWLAFIFAWFPHHPDLGIGRYIDTRVAAFPGSRFLARGHDYHALHHLFPRVPHTRLRALWDVVGEDLVTKGVRAEGTARYATGPIRW